MLVEINRFTGCTVVVEVDGGAKVLDCHDE